MQTSTTTDILLALARRYAFGDLAALVAASGRPDAAEIGRICAFGQRLLDLDAEDFAAPASAPKGSLAQRVAACRIPQHPDEHPRGALDSLVPAYRLLLEVIAARWARREMSALVATLHITAEYLPLLAWESTLGHAGDPHRLVELVRVPGSRFGTDDRAGDRGGSSCAHHGADRAGAQRLLRMPGADSGQWRDYLDRQHSNVAHAMGVCAARCGTPCAVVDQLRPDQATDLARRGRLALAYGDSALVRLRHSAPVGHGFGVPSPAEVTEAWRRSRQRLGPAAATADGFPLPGLPSFLSVVAGRPVLPETLLADTARILAAVLTRQPEPARD